MSPVSSVIKIGCDIQFIHGGRSFIYMMSNRGRIIGACGISIFQCTPIKEKKNLLLLDSININFLSSVS